MEELFVQLKFRELSKYGFFTDALYFPYEDFQKVNRKSIENLKTDRITNYEYAVENPPPIVEITKEDILQSIENLENQKVSLQTLLIESYDPTKEELQVISDKLDEQKITLQDKIDKLNIKGK